MCLLQNVFSSVLELFLSIDVLYYCHAIERFLFSILVRPGCDSGGNSSFFISMFSISLFLASVVPNQRHLSIVVSDWESYLGSLFSNLFFVGSCFLCCRFALQNCLFFSLLFCLSVLSNKES